ncbi:hypothetical protein [Sporosarcina sp. FA9]|uniref:hypothetical protein n=1 Tax=Sporosarcina sp. FA9 TaxID=3413030 RepID=UPI003F65695E
MKQIIFLLISIMLGLVGCSNTQEGQEVQEDLESIESLEIISTESDIDRNDLDKVKFYARLMNRYDYLEYLLTELNDITEKLYTLGHKGYKLKGYEEGMMVLEMYSNGYTDLSESFVGTIESKNKFLIDSQIYEEDLWELEKVYELTDKVMREFENAYEQMEFYMKTDNELHIEKYYYHSQNCYDLMLEAKLIAVNGESKYYEMIVLY